MKHKVLGRNISGPRENLPIPKKRVRVTSRTVLQQRYLSGFQRWLIGCKGLDKNLSKAMSNDIRKIKEFPIGKFDTQTQSTIWKTVILFFEFLDERHGNNFMPEIRDSIYKHLSDIHL